MTLVVVIGALWRTDRVLLGHRRAEDRCGGLWEFPGGKVEPGESDEAALQREWREELDLDIAVGDLCYTQRFEATPDVPAFTARTYRVYTVGLPSLKVHSALYWATPAELTDFALTPAGIGALARGHWAHVPTETNPSGWGLQRTRKQP